MVNSIVRQDVQSLVDGWLQAERDGVPFPVPFDAAWPIAGYSTKANGKRGLKALEEGIDFSSMLMKNGRRGRSSESILLSCDAFKHLCLMAETPEGREVRDYFIESEKRWRLVQQQHPAIAQEIELERLRNEGRGLELQKNQVELQILQFRDYVTKALPEPVQQKILGYAEVKVVEYRDRILHNDDVVNDGSTATKTELCHRYGLKTRAGKPDYKALNERLAELPSEAFSTSVRLQENNELRREYLHPIDRIVDNGPRTGWLGE